MNNDSLSTSQNAHRMQVYQATNQGQNPKQMSALPKCEGFHTLIANISVANDEMFVKPGKLNVNAGREACTRGKDKEGQVSDSVGS